MLSGLDDDAVQTFLLDLEKATRKKWDEETRKEREKEREQSILRAAQASYDNGMMGLGNILGRAVCDNLPPR